MIFEVGNINSEAGRRREHGQSRKGNSDGPSRECGLS